MNMVSIKGFHAVPKSAGMIKSKMDTVMFTVEDIEGLRKPPFQRPITINDKMRQSMAELLSNGGVIEGVITIGELDGERWIVDGQHRLKSFLMSGMNECYADVRVCQFETMAEMAKEFVRLNSFIARFKPDDILKGLEESLPALKMITNECPFVGYHNIRRNNGTSVPIIGMAQILRIWKAAGFDVPALRSTSAADLAAELTEDQARACIRFLNVVYAAWGRDIEYARLWSMLNMSICAWLWNKIVIGTYSARITKLTPEQFKRGMMGLSAATDYVDWLLGRQNTDRDRSPAYSRIKGEINKRLVPELGHKIILPSPPWDRRQ